MRELCNHGDVTASLVLGGHVEIGHELDRDPDPKPMDQPPFLCVGLQLLSSSVTLSKKFTSARLECWTRFALDCRSLVALFLRVKTRKNPSAGDSAASSERAAARV